MTQTADEFINQDAKEKPGVPLDRYDRYLIIPEGETNAVPHTRATTIAKALDDGNALTNWKVRLTAFGLSRRRDLYARVASLSLEDSDKRALNGVCVDAQEAAESRAGANIGTSLHRWCEQSDRGEEINVPEPWNRDVAAYRAKLAEAGIEVIPEFIEQLVVLPQIGPTPAAGTMDRLVDFGSLPKVADVKTGKIRDNVVIQLAIYANARTRYDWRNRKHLPMPEVDKDVALLIHLPEGQGRCDLYWIDIAAGWEAVEHCLWVRNWRKRKDLIDPWAPATRLDSVIERRTGLEERVETLRAIPGALAALAQAWPAGLPTLKQSSAHTPDQLTEIDRLLAPVEAKFSAPFGPLDASNVIPLNRTQETP